MNKNLFTTNHSNSLTAVQQAIIPISFFAAEGNMTKLNTSLNEGLEAGLTINDIREILVQLYAYAGFPRSLNALAEFKAVVETRKEKGIKDVMGQEPNRPIPIGKELLAAGKANQTKLVGSPVSGPLFDFSPISNQYLQTHLFGDIFERDNLSWQNRELATISMIAALPGTDSQLQSHINMSKNIGVTSTQLHQLCEVLNKKVSSKTAERVNKLLINN